MVDPFPVDGLQEYQPFHLTQLLRADLLLLALVGPQRRGYERLLEIIAAGAVRKGCVRQCRDQPRRKLLQSFQVPLFGAGIGGAVRVHQGPQQPLDHVQHVLAQVLPGQRLAALPVDDLALHVHDVVILQHVFAHIEVILFDLLLSILNLSGHERVLDRRVLVDAQPVHNRRHPLASEQPHQFIIEPHIEA